MIRRSSVLLTAFALVTALGGAAAAAQTSPAAPTITLDRSTVEPGDTVLVTIDGFESNAVTLTVCGNAARRRSVDCNLVASEGQHLQRSGEPTVSVLPVAPPDLPCPCVVLAATKTFGQVALAPIEIVGHPVGPVVGAPAREPLAVTVSARKAPRGVVAALRSALAGPTTYEVTVTVTNRSTEAVPNVTLVGAVGRSQDDDLVDLDLPPVGELGPGQTWTHLVRPEVPAPVLGDLVFHVTAAGAGPSVGASETTSSLPIALVALLVVLMIDLGAIGWRRAAQRRARRSAPSGADGPNVAPAGT